MIGIDEKVARFWYGMYSDRLPWQRVIPSLVLLWWEKSSQYKICRVDGSIEIRCTDRDFSWMITVFKEVYISMAQENSQTEGSSFSDVNKLSKSFRPVFCVFIGIICICFTNRTISVAEDLNFIEIKIITRNVHSIQYTRLSNSKIHLQFERRSVHPHLSVVAAHNWWDWSNTEKEAKLSFSFVLQNWMRWVTKSH